MAIVNSIYRRTSSSVCACVVYRVAQKSKLLILAVNEINSSQTRVSFTKFIPKLVEKMFDMCSIVPNYSLKSLSPFVYTLVDERLFISITVQQLTFLSHPVFSNFKSSLRTRLRGQKNAASASWQLVSASYSLALSPRLLCYRVF